MIDKNILDTVYALAIKYRLTSLGVEENEYQPGAPRITKKTKKEPAISTTDISV